jgi:large subunit ribosomal protein L15
MKHVGNLQKADGSTHSKKRIGRGPGSGHGGTSTRGHKGQKARSGAHVKPYFEGGQMPLIRRIPKFGFFNRNRIEYQVINVGDIQQLVDENKLNPENITFASLYEAGVIRKRSMPVKILGDGELNAALKIEAHKFTNSAKQKIESVGGTINIHG